MQQKKAALWAELVHDAGWNFEGIHHAGSKREEDLRIPVRRVTAPPRDAVHADVQSAFLNSCVSGAFTVNLPNPGYFQLRQGVVPELTIAADRVVLWVAGRQEANSRCWERVSTLRTDIDEEDGFSFIGATSISLEQRVSGFWGKIRRLFGNPDSPDSWITPDGNPADQTGCKRADLMLVWGHDPFQDLDDAELRARWPHAQEFQRLGKNLFLLVGVEEHQTDYERFNDEAAEQRLHAKEDDFGELSRREGDPHKQAQSALAAARRQDDKAKEALALIDLGAVLLKLGGAEDGVRHLEEAAAIARQTGETTIEYDALANLGTGYLVLGRIPEAFQIFHRVLDHARETRDRFAEKMMLSKMGDVFSAGGKSRRALAYHESALQIARDVGDRNDEATLLWNMAISYEELGEGDAAIYFGQAAVDIHQQLDSPRVGILSEHLQKFREGNVELKSAELANSIGQVSSSTFRGASASVSPVTSAKRPNRPPSVLRMAYTGTSALAKFIGSGFKTVSQEAKERRLEVCGDCEHHTGLRCRLCGCFTAQKAWLPHEHCPLQKWPV